MSNMKMNTKKIIGNVNKTPEQLERTWHAARGMSLGAIAATVDKALVAFESMITNFNEDAWLLGSECSKPVYFMRNNHRPVREGVVVDGAFSADQVLVNVNITDLISNHFEPKFLIAKDEITLQRIKVLIEERQRRFGIDFLSITFNGTNYDL